MRGEAGKGTNRQSGWIEYERKTIISDWRHDGGRENNRRPDFKEAAAGLRVSGRGLVLGYGSVSGYRGDKKDGHEKYHLFAEQLFNLQRL